MSKSGIESFLSDDDDEESECVSGLGTSAIFSDFTRSPNPSNEKQLLSKSIVPRMLANESDESLIEADGAIVGSSRWILGHSSRGRINSRLLIRDELDPEFARFYYIKWGGENLFTCKCKKVTASLVDGGVKYVHGEAVGHQCQAHPFKVLFFQLKKWFMIFGTVEEIEKCESATRLACDKIDRRLWTQVDQRDWDVVVSQKVKKNTVVIVREENRNIARDYAIQEKKTTKDKMFYACIGCNQVEVVVFNLESGLKSVWRSSDKNHSTKCLPKSIKDLEETYSTQFSDNLDMDIHRIVPVNEWKLGITHYGHEDCKLMVKEVSDNSKCYDYYYCVTKNHSDSKRVYICTKCKATFRAYLIPSMNNRVVACRVKHYKCEPKLIREVMDEQKKRAKLVESRKKNAFSTKKPEVPNSRLLFSDDDSKFFIVRSGHKNVGQEFVATGQVRKQRSISTKLFKCTTCPATAYFQHNAHGRKLVQNDPWHAMTCKLITTKQWMQDNVSGKALDLVDDDCPNRDEEKPKVVVKKRRRTSANSDKQIAVVEPQRKKPIRQEIVKDDEPIRKRFSPMKKAIFPDPVVDENISPVKGVSQKRLFVMPSNLWLNQCCETFNVKSSKAAYKAWGCLSEVDLNSSQFPSAENIKLFSDGFSLISYLTTGSEDKSFTVKEEIKKYFFDNRETMDVVGDVEFSKMGKAEIKQLLFPTAATRLHFAVLSIMLNCTVVLYDYVDNKRSDFESNDSQAPTMVIGSDGRGFFIFVDE